MLQHAGPLHLCNKPFALSRRQLWADRFQRSDRVNRPHRVKWPDRRHWINRFAPYPPFKFYEMPSSLLFVEGLSLSFLVYL